ncbi:coproporphyrinogen III oxidase [Hymenobacter convexus]|uniref:coproporphyrinogen III oxidase n=1 Tax=Hymenobacter sp. CA1UV-4 TaxID=3063782 RepID=UPI00271244E8|nr:coproporphyrinogen III oxidase [Hymenobacter sp. CA1UV-4]MDO7852457.1 coproporphyrinogen III oxidase [Hymenobacter sp. CA1UV-4]
MHVAPRTEVEAWMRQYQDWLCHRLEAADGSGTRFSSVESASESGGLTCTRVLQQGAVVEKGSVVFSSVRNQMSRQPASASTSPSPPRFGASVRVVQHPRSPMVPISHLNLRYVEARNGDAWFGGGLDLTPIYVDERQARWFHEQLAEVCQQHDPGYYARFKQRADEYFYLPHRRETRGVGGLCFDRLTVGRDGLFEELFAFVQDVGEVYGRTYGTLMRQNAALPYTPREQAWQLVRRGRYAEFSLLVERAALAGDEAEHPNALGLGLPPQAAWPPTVPEPDSPEAHTQRHLRQGIDWLNAA